MIKRLQLICLFICFVILLTTCSHARMTSLFYGGQPAAAGGTCDSCAGVINFAWHMEVADIEDTDNLPCGCSASADKTFATVGSPTLSSTQKSDGAYSVYIDALDEGYEIDITTASVDIDDIKITFDLWWVTDPTGSSAVIEIYDTDNNRVMIYMNDAGPGTLYASRAGNSTTDTVLVYPTSGEWLHVEYQAKVGVAGNDHYLYWIEDDAGANGSDEDDDDLVANNVDPTTLLIGDRDQSSGTSGVSYIDNVKIYVSDRY